jgi:uncharacterized protein
VGQAGNAGGQTHRKNAVVCYLRFPVLRRVERCIFLLRGYCKIIMGQLTSHCTGRSPHARFARPRIRAAEFRRYAAERYGSMTEIRMILLIFALLLFIFLPQRTTAQERPLPIIDMHLHAKSAPNPQRPLCTPVTVYGVVEPKCTDPFLSPLTDAAMIEQTVAILERRNIIGVISGFTAETVGRFQKAAPDQLIPAYQLNLGDAEHLSPESLRRHIKAGDFAVLGEIENQYAGIRPDDQRMEPYWSLAEELDIPVALHLGEAYPGAPYMGSPKYRAGLGSPLALEEVLVRHPKLRIYVMHYGSPFINEMIALLYSYPQVYVDIGGNQWTYPRPFFYAQLQQLIDAGFGKRIMFGSDNMWWPGLIEYAITIIEEAPFLSNEQKRDILYNNAARFLRLSAEEIARHHGK